MAQPTREAFVAMTVLGLDHGEARLGVALKPAGQSWALPVRIVEIDSEAEAIVATRALIAKYQAQAVVVGLPLHADRTQAQAVRRFCRKAREGTLGVRWWFTNELLTSEAAEYQAGEARGGNRRRSTREAPSDDLAAQLILDTFAASLETGGNN